MTREQWIELGIKIALAFAIYKLVSKWLVAAAADAKREQLNPEGKYSDLFTNGENSTPSYEFWENAYKKGYKYYEILQGTENEEFPTYKTTEECNQIVNRICEEIINSMGFVNTDEEALVNAFLSIPDYGILSLVVGQWPNFVSQQTFVIGEGSYPELGANLKEHTWNDNSELLKITSHIDKLKRDWSKKYKWNFKTNSKAE